MKLSIPVTVEKIDACLPQTQCGECDYDGCMPYAKAILKGEANIDKCPPGGLKTLDALATLTEQDPTPYREKVRSQTRPAQVVVIQEDACIGCTKCIQACPVDAIMGSAKHMHTVIESECTGCQLCITPCPVDCIDVKSIPESKTPQPDLSRQRYNARNQRLERIQNERTEKHRTNKKLKHRDYIQEAIARVNAKRGASKK